MRRLLAWIALPLVLPPCAALESADQPTTNCPNATCIVLATAHSIDDVSAPDENGETFAYFIVTEEEGAWEIDYVTATLETSLHGSLRKGRFRVQVPHGSVRVEQPPGLYLIVLEPAGRDRNFPDLESFQAIEAYAIKDGKVCTFRALGEYAPTDGARYRFAAVNPPSSQRKHCYGIDDLKRKAW